MNRDRYADLDLESHDAALARAQAAIAKQRPTYRLSHRYGLAEHLPPPKPRLVLDTPILWIGTGLLAVGAVAVIAGFPKVAAGVFAVAVAALVVGTVAQ